MRPRLVGSPAVHNDLQDDILSLYYLKYIRTPVKYRYTHHLVFHVCVRMFPPMEHPTVVLSMRMFPLLILNLIVMLNSRDHLRSNLLLQSMYRSTEM